MQDRAPRTDRVQRNYPAEESVRRALGRDYLKDVDTDLRWPVPVSPSENLRRQVVVSDPGMARGLTEVLGAMRPSLRQLQAVADAPHPTLLNLAREQGLDPRYLNVLGMYRRPRAESGGLIHLDPDWSAQEQYETLLHELTHAAGGSELDARIFDDTFITPSEVNTRRPSLLSGGAPRTTWGPLRPSRPVK